MEAFTFIELAYFTIVRDVRTESGTASLGLLVANLRIMSMVAIFYAMFAVIGMKGAPVRGDMLLFVLTGVQVFLMHNSAVQAVVTAGSSTSPIMMHAPMTTALSIISKTMAQLYLNVLAGFFFLTGIFLYKGDIEILHPQYAILPWVMGWFSGVIVGLLFLLLKPLLPTFMPVLSTAYQRANLITSGKFWVANMIPASVLPYFTWNPLFHSIDQLRGHVFVNYVPKNTSIEYVLWFCAIGLIVGMMGEFWIRKTQSRSAAATR